MATRSSPWQYEWKRPQWQTPQDRTEKKYSYDQLGVPLCFTSAQVLSNELKGLKDGPPTTQPPQEPQHATPPHKEEEENRRVSYSALELLQEQQENSSSIEEQQDVAGTTCNLLLAVTLFSSSKTAGTTSKKDMLGDLVLLELIQTSNDNDADNEASHRIHTCILRWPGSVLNEERDAKPVVTGGEEEQDTNRQDKKPWHHYLSPWRNDDATQKSQEPSKIGLASIALCRRPPQNDNTAAASAVDALDVLNLMSLGLAPVSSSSSSADPLGMQKQQQTASVDGGKTKVTHDDSNATELMLVCLTTDGRVHVYDAIQLFQPTRNVQEDDQVALGLASLLLGQDILQNVQQSILPLSQPCASIALSVPIKKKKKRNNGDEKKTKKQQQHSEEDASSKASAASSIDQQQQQPKADAEEQQLAGEGLLEEHEHGIGWWDGSLWDATVEPSTALYRTLQNVPTICVPAFEYVAVGGRGTRRRWKRRKRFLQDQKEERSISSAGSQSSIPQAATAAPTAGLEPVLEEKEDAGDEVINWWGDEGDAATSNEGDIQETDHKAEAEANPFNEDWLEQDHKAKAEANHKAEAEANPFNEAWLEQDHKAKADANPFNEDWLEQEVSTQTSGATNERPPSQKAPKWKEYRETGGFVTFISLRHYAEERTVYLPFAPKQLSPVVWGGMRFVLVLGEEEVGGGSPVAMAIRVDSYDILTTPCGEAPSIAAALLESTNDGGNNATAGETFGTLDNNASLGLNASGDREESTSTKRKQMCTVRRFHPIPVALPVEDEMRSSSVVACPLAASTMFTVPPSIAVLYATLPSSGEEDDADGDTVVALYTLQALDVATTHGLLTSLGQHGRWRTDRRGSDSGLVLTIQTGHYPGHLARIPCRIESEQNLASVWCHIGQGWSLIGADNQVYFACWEGATESDGAFVAEVHSFGENQLLDSRLVCGILPTNPLLPKQFVDSRHGAIEIESMDQSTRWNLPFTSPYDMHLTARWTDWRKSIRGQIDFGEREGSGAVLDGVLIDALDSLSNLNYRETGPVLSPQGKARKQSMLLSSGEKSRRLFRGCSSWEQLDDSEHNRMMTGGQEPMVAVRLGPQPEQHFVLSLRRRVVENGGATPFNQVLAWMCLRKHYFTAASVGLDLLGDADALRDLRRITDTREDADERASLEGLLDGIIPLDFDYEQITTRAHSTLTQLADMTVGCLVKGGLAMSNTLQGFLRRNVIYDPGRACLMLSATAACSVSGDKELVKSVMGVDYQEKSGGEQVTDLLWPIRCLLQIAVSREYLPTALLLLNEAIPSELRRKPRGGGEASAPRPSLELCTSIVRMIVESSPDAAELLLGLMDEETRSRYWQSLEHDTQLALSLIAINGKFPLLREAEVRTWALQHIHRCIEAIEGSSDSAFLNVLELVPTDWLQELCTACLKNAGCSLVEVCSEEFEVDSDIDGIQRHLEELRMTQNALVPSLGSGGLDFDLLIPALLLLEHRGEFWCDDAAFVSTQSILDAACYLAGRQNAQEPVFAFDGSTVMRQCAISGNVSAGANLIGGRDGLVLMCCDVLVKGAGMSMDDAEEFLLKEKGPTESPDFKPNAIQADRHLFALSDGHRQLLWLLDEHVLSVKTFGEFETVHIRGRVDPVFAARTCFRTWYCLNKTSKVGTSWLVSWLRERLGIDKNTISRKRLACAAISRALLWPEGVHKSKILDAEPDQLLATALGIESSFLVELSQSCCGLIESIPPSLADELLRNTEETSSDDGFGAAALQVDV